MAAQAGIRSRTLIAVLLAVLIELAIQGCAFGGSDGGNFSAARLGAIPTATLPANLSEPIKLGESAAIPGSTPTSPDGELVTYVVQPGDTLGAIADLFGVPEDQKAAWNLEVLRINGIADARLLQAEQELVLPSFEGSGDSPDAVQTPAPSIPTATTADGSSATYTVLAGDYPILIAQKLGIPEASRLAWAEQLLLVNGASESGLSVGQILQLPTDTP